MPWPGPVSDEPPHPVRVVLDTNVLVSGDADLLLLAGQLEDLESMSPAQFVSWWKHLPHQASPR